MFVYLFYQMFYTLNCTVTRVKCTHSTMATEFTSQFVFYSAANCKKIGANMQIAEQSEYALVK